MFVKKRIVSYPKHVGTPCISVGPLFLRLLSSYHASQIALLFSSNEVTLAQLHPYRKGGAEKHPKRGTLGYYFKGNEY